MQDSKLITDNLPRLRELGFKDSTSESSLRSRKRTLTRELPHLRMTLYVNYDFYLTHWGKFVRSFYSIEVAEELIRVDTLLGEKE